MIYDISIDGKRYNVEVSRGDGHWSCKVEGEEVQFDAAPAGEQVLSLLVGGKSYEVKLERGPLGSHIWVGSNRYAVEVCDPRSFRGRKSNVDSGDGPRKLVAPMTGKVVRLLVQEKQTVEAGQGVVVVEAMKMQNEIKSPKAGIVQKLVAAVGTSVNAGDLLAVVE